MTQRNISMKQNPRHENKFVFSKGRGSWEGRIGNLGLTDASMVQKKLY